MRPSWYLNEILNGDDNNENQDTCIIENPKSQCPMNHAQSKFYASHPDQHILLCKCECPWCQEQFHEKPAFATGVGLHHSGTGKDH